MLKLDKKELIEDLNNYWCLVIKKNDDDAFDRLVNAGVLSIKDDKIDYRFDKLVKEIAYALLINSRQISNARLIDVFNIAECIIQKIAVINSCI